MRARQQKSCNTYILSRRRKSITTHRQTSREQQRGLVMLRCVEQSRGNKVWYQLLSVAKALRVLRLLEEQHVKLARIISTQDTIEADATVVETGPAKDQPSSKDSRRNVTSPERANTKAGSTTSALAASRAGGKARESSPSLARDIASRRGIPQSGRSQPSPAAQARARQLSPESQRRVRSGGTPRASPSMISSQANLREGRKAKKEDDDESFTKFYSNLTSGTMSKISSVLAFAGLPLTAEESQPDQNSKSKSERRTVTAGNDVDVKKIFSKAALDAIEDEHRQRGTLGHGFGPTESFYVVQKGGGTYSYADIARAQQHQLSGIGEEEEVEFVDAKEVLAPPSPRFSNEGRGSFGKPRTQEELELENSTLKQTLEQVAGRLANFEAHAQDASMAALTQSMVSLRPPTSGGVGGGGGVQDVATHERIRMLERQVEQQAEGRQKLEGLASRQEKMLKKYHYKWEEVKKSAKEKDRIKKERAEKGTDEDGGEGSGAV